MEISLRTYLTAGTVAVVGAGAIAMTPILPAVSPAVPVPTPVVAQVDLAAFSLSDVVGFLGNLGIGGALPGILTALPSLLPADIVTAVVNEFVNQAGPLVTTAAAEVFGYLGTALTGLIAGPNSIPVRFGEALAGIPTVLVTAIGALSTGDLPTALQTLADGLAAPIAGITQAIAEAQQAFQDFVTAEFNGLLTALPGVLFTAVQTVLGGNLQTLIGSIGTALSDLIGGLFPAPGASLAAPAAAAALPAGPQRSVTVSVVTEQAPPAAASQAAGAETVQAPEVAPLAPTVEASATSETVAPAPRTRPAQVRPAASEPASAVTPDVSVETKPAPQPTAGKAGAAKSGKGRAQSASATAE